MFEGQGMPSYRVAGSSRCFSLGVFSWCGISV